MVSEYTRHPSRPLLILILIQVPVIAIFTKMDALDDEAYNQLMWEDDVPPAKIKAEVPIRAEAIFKKNYLQRLLQVKHMPRYVVQLRGMLLFVHDSNPRPMTHSDMNKEGINCNELIVRTSQALHGGILRLFCLSILRNDVVSRVKQVINE
jgi:hypothetical protein